ncbi:MAG: hypothetical protein WCT16_00035 [Candidatus Buchananbacteria bacterium]
METEGSATDGLIISSDSAKALGECQSGRHDLKIICSHVVGPSFVSETVRWCKVCGSIVKDCDCDNRVNPGAIMPMLSPLVVSLFAEIADSKRR